MHTASEHTWNGQFQSNAPWSLRLYVSASRASRVARSNLSRIIAEHLPKDSTVEVLDVIDHPAAAEDDQVLAIPTLVRKSPPPTRRIIGDLSDTARVLNSLGFTFELTASDLS